MGPRGKEGSLKLNTHHAVPFLLGAALPTILLFVLASDRVGDQLSSVSGGWWGGNGGIRSAAPAVQEYEEKFPGLAQLLPRVATEDRTVILTSVNEAWAQPGSLLEIYLESFKNGEDTAHLLDHLLVVVLDPACLSRCVSLHPHCYLLENVTTANLTSATPFMSKQYLELVWTKLSLQQRVLELGYNFLFTDADMVVLRNPFRRIPVYADMSVSSDDFSPAWADPLAGPDLALGDLVQPSRAHDGGGPILRRRETNEATARPAPALDRSLAWLFDCLPSGREREGDRRSQGLALDLPTPRKRQVCASASGDRRPAGTSCSRSVILWNQTEHIKLGEGVEVL